jgi:hypothetical protein
MHFRSNFLDEVLSQFIKIKHSAYVLKQGPFVNSSTSNAKKFFVKTQDVRL